MVVVIMVVVNVVVINVVVAGVVIIATVVAGVIGWRGRWHGPRILHVDHRVWRGWWLRGRQGHHGCSHGDAEGEDCRDGRGNERRPHSLRVGSRAQVSPLTR